MKSRRLAIFDAEDKKLLATIKRIILKSSPRFLVKPALAISRKIRVIRYKTDMMMNPEAMAVYCPCCGMRFKAFNGWDYRELPDRFNSTRYEGIRQDVLCPICRALPRHRILALWCEKYQDSFRSSKILYFAPEYSMMLWMKRNGVKCTTADLFSEADLKLDIQNTGFTDESYDMVIANHVLEHVDDFRVALKEVNRILKTNGVFICSFPMDPKVEMLDEEEAPLSEVERIRRFGQYDHKRVFGMKADQFLKEAGFEVETIDGNSCPDEILPIVGPADYDMNRLFCCRK